MTAGNLSPELVDAKRQRDYSSLGIALTFVTFILGVLTIFLPSLAIAEASDAYWSYQASMMDHPDVAVLQAEEVRGKLGLAGATVTFLLAAFTCATIGIASATGLPVRKTAFWVGGSLALVAAIFVAVGLALA